MSDATGAEIERALVAPIPSAPETTMLDQALALDLLLDDGRCVGLDVLSRESTISISLRGVVWCWRMAARGNSGCAPPILLVPPPTVIALAWRAGAALADLEFAQFHPTILVAARPKRRAVPDLGGGARRGCLAA